MKLSKIIFTKNDVVRHKKAHKKEFIDRLFFH